MPRSRAQRRAVSPEPPSGERRGQILDAAEGLFAEHGFGASMRELAEAAGMNVATLYYHVGSKEEIILAIHARLVERVVGHMQDVLGRDAPFARKAAALIDRMIELLASRPNIPRFMARADLGEIPSIKAAEPEIYGPVMRMAVQELERRAEAGEIRRVDPLRFLAAAHGVILSLSLQSTFMREAAGERSADAPENLEPTKRTARMIILGCLGLDWD